MVQIDHVGIPSSDARASAYFLARILAAPEPTPDGADEDMFRVQMGDGAFVLFNPAPKIDFVHMAFRVSVDELAAIVDRLRNARIPFGNDPDATTNGETSDPLGGNGRVYFHDRDGHLFEATA